MVRPMLGDPFLKGTSGRWFANCDRCESILLEQGNWCPFCRLDIEDGLEWPWITRVPGDMGLKRKRPRKYSRASPLSR